MEIKLNSLNLKNFQGIRSFQFVPEDRNATVLGQNATGKTTLFNAFLWLLFGKDSQGKADFAIKTLDNHGQEIHNLNHGVEAILNLGDQPIALKKEFVEKYTKKRGQPKAEFTGHTTNHFIDGVPVQQKEWTSRIQAIIDEETFKLLTSPTYFNSLHWQKRREILLQVCGNILDADVIASDKGLSDLPEILANRSLQDQRKIVAAKKREINERLKEIPARIDELQKSLIDVSIHRETVIQSKILELEHQIRTIKDDTTMASLRKQKAEIEAKLSEAQVDLAKEKNKIAKDFDEKIGGIQEELRIIAHSDLKSLSLGIIDAEKLIDQNEKEMSQLREKFQEISRQEFRGDTICPTCGQDLPKDRVEKAILKHNEQKADNLAKINKQGKESKQEIEDLKKTKADLEFKRTEIKVKINDLEFQLQEAKNQKDASLSETGKTILELIEKLNIEITQINEAMSANIIPDTSTLESELKQERTKIAEIEASKKASKRIEELGQEEKTLAAEYEKLERQLYLMDQFVVAKVNLLEEKINSKFEMARFKLFNVLVNGGIEECCETIVDGVPFSSLNDGHRILVGCDIVKTLQNHYDMKAPLFLDHAEALSSKPEDLGCQMIFLEVSQDPELSIKYQE